MKTLFIIVILIGMFRIISAQGVVRITPLGNVGIGVDPHAPLQFNNDNVNRKVVLYESANNDHQFYGFGIGSASLRYQVDAPWASHVFYTGTSDENSQELMRIQGNGNVGIGVVPTNLLDIGLGGRSGSHSTGRPLYITGFIGASDDGIEIRHANGTQGIGFGYNTMYAAGSVESQDLGLRAKGPDGNLLFSTTGFERMRITNLGNVGIGTTTPTYKLSVNNKFGIDANGSTHFVNVPRQIYFYEDGLPSKMILSHSPSYPTWGLQYTAENQFRFLKDSAAVMTVDLGANNVSISGNAIISGNATITGNTTISGALNIGYVRIFGSSVNVNPLTFGSATCNCPSGLVAIGGGFWVSDSASQILASYASNNTTWYVNMWNAGITTHQLQAFAICARLAN